MAFFKFRKEGDAQSPPPPAPESIEAMRKRARYRLAGAAILVALGVIGFPLVFDNQPRPIAVDIAIDIPDKAKVAPLPAPVEAAAPAQAPGASQPPSLPASVPAPAAPVAPAVSSGAAPTPPKPVEKSPAAAPAAVAVPAPAVAASASDAAKAQALLDGKSVDKAPAVADALRFVVQFGAYSDAGKAHEARVKVEKAGLKTYSQMVQGPDGKVYRVRVGPLASRAEAEKAAEKIKKLNLPASILEL
jgi:DedD protein